jgi:hypothetical protein
MALKILRFRLYNLVCSRFEMSAQSIVAVLAGLQFDWLCRVLIDRAERFF